ncbi:hypothetical protein [Schlesneria paludicola]|uniref:hypothetical protein n=1 Tax=Schlesneria paludicola TaxID=360056 RepID=UPI00029A464B|nr:hypothetical protein [Schlesneria paludicola]
MRSHRILFLLILCSLRTVAAEPSAPSDKIIAQRVQEMFQIGFVRGPREIQESQRLYDSLRNASGSDSRVDYAHGLISLRQMKNKEAKDDFLAAIKRPGTAYFPAWRALVWTHFLAKEYDTGHEHLLEFVKLVEKSDDLTTLMRNEELYWIGRIMAAVELTSESALSREKWTQYEEQLIDLLSEDAIDVYRGGKEEVSIRQANLEQEARQTQERGKKKEALQRQKKLDRLEKSLETADKKREALKKSAAELKEILDEQADEFKKQMERSEKDYSFLERRAMTLMSAMMALDQEMSVLQLRRGNPASNAARDQSLILMQNVRMNYELEYMRIINLVQQTSSNAKQLQQQNGQLNDQYNQATRELVKDEAAIKEQKARSLKQADLLKKENAESKSPAIPKRIETTKSLRAYVDLDVFAERDSVLKSFGVTIDDK